MLVLFLIMMVGFICRRRGLLSDEAVKKISGLVVSVTNPALILSSGINPDEVLPLTTLAKIFALAIVVYIAIIIVAMVLPVILHVDRKDRGVYQAMMIFSNIGFMGFPLITAVYGSDAMVMATAFIVPYNVLIYTFGVRVMSEGGSQAASGKKTAGQAAKEILNTGVIACIVSIVLYTTRFHIPSVLEDTVDYLSSLTAPLSMLIIGDSMTKIKFREMLSDWRMSVFSIASLLVVPIAGVLILKQCGISGDLLGVCMIMLATPVGSMNVMLAQQYDGNYELASKGVALTTVLSVITIPIVSMFI